MPIQKYEITLQAEGNLQNKNRKISANEIISTWAAGNVTGTVNPLWGLSSEGYLQMKDTPSQYAYRYGDLNLHLTDYSFNVTVIPSGSGNYEVGFIFRFQNNNSFYYLTMNGGYVNWGDKNIRVVRKTGATHTTIAQVTHPVFVLNKEYFFEIELLGSNIKISLDGVAIVDIVDTTPITSGSFGPLVKGQEFAKWKEFAGESNTAFVIQKKIASQELETNYFDTATSKLIASNNIAEMMKAEVDAYLSKETYDGWSYKRFMAISNNPSVKLIFDKTLGKNITTDPNSLLYGYQVLPTIPPLPVVNLVGTAINETSIELTWTHVDDSEDGYYVINETDKIIVTLSEGITSYIETGLKGSTTYYRRVVPFNTAGKAIGNTEVVVTTLDSLPDAPSNFQGTAIDGSSILWEWTDLSYNERSFEIVKIESDGTEIVVGTVGPNTTEWLETGLIHMTTYERAIRSRNDAGASAISDIVSITTPEILPDPPTMTPMNFVGVAISHEEIVWSWEDLNKDADGFRIYNEDGVLIKQIVKDFHKFTESSLYSAMEYRRQIAAYNRGGDGPRSDFAYAKTMNYGYHRDGTPLEPYNLRVSDIEKTQARLRWEYKEHDLLQAVGFKIYTELGQLVEVIPSDITERLIQNLIPDMPYSMYVVAFNENGDSLKTNVISWVTQKDEVPEDDIIEEETTDLYYGVQYDKETNDTPKIKAFHSGVGDNLDLIVRPLANKIFENFQYEMYITAKYRVPKITYPMFHFKYQLVINGVKKDGTAYTDSSEWIYGVVQGSAEGSEMYKTIITVNPLPEDIVKDSLDTTILFYDEKDNSVLPYNQNKKELIHWLLDVNDDVYTITAWTNEFEQSFTEERWNGSKITSDMLRVDINDTKIISSRVQSPMYQTSWNEINGRYQFIKGSYQLVVTSLNSNVQIIIDSDITSFFPEQSIFIDFLLKASIINFTQTSWYPQIHSGYYYINQQEFFLFADDKVLEKDNVGIKAYVYDFTYLIKVVFERIYKGDTRVFTDNTLSHISLGDIGKGISIHPKEGILTLEEVAKEGVFESRMFDFGALTDNWLLSNFTQDMEAIAKGASVVFELGPTNFDGDVLGWYAPEDCPPTQNIRYRLTLKSNEYKENGTMTFIDNGHHYFVENIEVLPTGETAIKDLSVSEIGTFITEPVYIGNEINNIGVLSLKEIIPPNTTCEIYSVSASSSTHDFSKPTATEPWIPVTLLTANNGKNVYKIHSLPNKYMAFVFVLNGQLITRLSPSISEIEYRVETYQVKQVVPVIKEVNISGYIENTSKLETYEIEQQGFVESDEMFHPITDQSIKAITLDYLIANSVKEPESLLLKDFLVSINPIHPIELKVGDTWDDVIYAKTTEETGTIIYKEEGLYLDKDTSSIVLTPIPQSGTPIVITNVSRQILRQVHFRDDMNKPSLTNREYLLTDDSRYLFLEFRVEEIDTTTVKVFADTNKEEDWKIVSDIKMIENRIVFPHLYAVGTPMIVSYKLNNSYVVDYNYDPIGDAARIEFNMSFDQNVKETRRLDIRYEASKKNAYYIADEVEINPMFNKINGGFVYLTDEYFQPNKLKVVCSHPYAYRNKKEYVLIHAYIYDEYENPVVGTRIVMEPKFGSIKIMNHITDANGMSIGMYYPPEDIEVDEDTVNVTVIGHTASSFLSKNIDIAILDETFFNRIYIIPTRYTINNDDEILVRVLVIGPNEQPVINQPIQITSSVGQFNKTNSITGHNGEAIFRLTTGSIYQDDYAVIEVTDGVTDEQIIVRTKGV